MTVQLASIWFPKAIGSVPSELGIQSVLAPAVLRDSNMTVPPPPPAVGGGMQMTSQKKEHVEVCKHVSLHIEMHVVNYLMCLLHSCHPDTTLQVAAARLEEKSRTTLTGHSLGPTSCLLPVAHRPPQLPPPGASPRQRSLPASLFFPPIVFLLWTKQIRTWRQVAPLDSICFGVSRLHGQFVNLFFKSHLFVIFLSKP